LIPSPSIVQLAEDEGLIKFHKYADKLTIIALAEANKSGMTGKLDMNDLVSSFGHS